MGVERLTVVGIDHGVADNGVTPHVLQAATEARAPVPRCQSHKVWHDDGGW